MSDFFSSGWSVFVAVATIASIVACLVLLFVASRRKAMAGDNTTGHVWDGDLVELNNPLPRWWMVLFVLTIVFSFGYLLLYPGLGSDAGQFGWTSVQQYQQEKAQAAEAAAPLYARFATMPDDDLARDAPAMAIGERLFMNNCSTCHGSDGRGSKGFPNLTDDDWLYGGDVATIRTTIAKGREGIMPPMAAAVGSAEEVRQLAQYVLSLSGGPHNPIDAQLSRGKFSACAACHGVGGKGNPALGAPNLSDRVWLHGWGEAAVVETITKGRRNVMPAHGDRLTPDQIRLLAIYVKRLSSSTTVARQ
jgi:cytochrome c oxidase cbb3-type subunit III